MGTLLSRWILLLRILCGLDLIPFFILYGVAINDYFYGDLAELIINSKSTAVFVMLLLLVLIFKAGVNFLYIYFTLKEKMENNPINSKTCINLAACGTFIYLIGILCAIPDARLGHYFQRYTCFNGALCCIGLLFVADRISKNLIRIYPYPTNDQDETDSLRFRRKERLKRMRMATYIVLGFDMTLFGMFFTGIIYYFCWDKLFRREYDVGSGVFVPILIILLLAKIGILVLFLSALLKRQNEKHPKACFRNALIAIVVTFLYDCIVIGLKMQFVQLYLFHLFGEFFIFISIGTCVVLACLILQFLQCLHAMSLNATRDAYTDVEEREELERINEANSLGGEDESEADPEQTLKVTNSTNEV